MKFMRMCLSLALFVLPATGSVALATDGMPVQFGATVGLNLSSMADSPEYSAPGYDESMRVGIRAGATAEYTIDEMFAIQGGLIYAMKGEKWKQSDSGYKDEGTSKLDYLCIPVVGKATLGKGDGPKPFVKAGPELGILLSAKSKGKETSGGSTHEYDVDIKDQLKSVDFGLQFGVGVELPVADFLGVVEASYTLGLANVLDTKKLTDSNNGKEESDSSSDPSSKNRVISIAVGIKF